jgi:hypothetical protein
MKRFMIKNVVEKMNITNTRETPGLLSVFGTWFKATLSIALYN